MAWTKIQTTVVVGCATLLLLGGTATIVLHQKKTNQEEALPPGVTHGVVSAEDQRTIERWKLMPLTPLTEKARLSALIDKIPVDGQDTASAEAVAMLRNYV